MRALLTLSLLVALPPAVSADVIEETGTARSELSDPGAPPARPAPSGAPSAERARPPDASRYAFFGFDLGPGLVLDAHDAPWAIVSRVAVGYQLDAARLSVSAEGGLLAEAFSHNQPTLRLCAEPGLGFPVDRTGLDLRAGAKGCVGVARLRDGGRDVWRYGLAVGGYLGAAFRMTRRLRLTVRVDAEAWAPDALGDAAGINDRSWAAILGASFGIELRF